MFRFGFVTSGKLFSEMHSKVRVVGRDIFGVTEVSTTRPDAIDGGQMKNPTDSLRRDWMIFFLCGVRWRGGKRDNEL